jgi:GABA permease
MVRYLVVANQTLAGDQLIARIRECSKAQRCRFHVLVPATRSRGSLLWTEGHARAVAAARLADAIVALRALAIDVEGSVGDERPFLAIRDALRAGNFDEIILSTLPPGISRWLHQDLPNRVERAFGLPVHHVIGSPWALSAGTR